MKAIVVDTNIIFSALVRKNSAIGEIIINSKEYQFFASEYTYVELKNHHDKLMAASKMTEDEMGIAKYTLFQYIKIMTLNTIPLEFWLEAEQAVYDIDVDDTPFVALAFYLDAYLWTGDKILYGGLKAKGFEKIVSTEELKLFLGD
jgi:predicted nucleic acid-binding protein